MKRGARSAHVLGGQEVVCGLAEIRASVGTGKYEAAYSALVWRVKRFPEKNAGACVRRVKLKSNVCM